MKKLVLIIEDEQDIQTLLEYHFKDAGFQILQAFDGEEGRLLAIEKKPDLILLDWMLPLMSGIELLRQLRNRQDTNMIPIIMLTAKAEESDRLRGLDGGADDYVSKPFSPFELLARVRALLRRSGQQYGSVLSGGDIEMNLDTKRVKRARKPIHLGPKELFLLEHFLRNQGRVYTRNQLLDTVWGADAYLNPRTIDVHIRRLRKALNAGGKPDMIRTIRSIGYAFES